MYKEVGIINYGMGTSTWVSANLNYSQNIKIRNVSGGVNSSAGRYYVGVQKPTSADAGASFTYNDGEILITAPQDLYFYFPTPPLGDYSVQVLVDDGSEVLEIKSSIAEQIIRIKNNIAQSYSIASNKGATLPAVKNSENLPNTIASITGGTGGGDTIDVYNASSYNLVTGDKVWINRRARSSYNLWLRWTTAQKQGSYIPLSNSKMLVLNPDTNSTTSYYLYDIINNETFKESSIKLGFSVTPRGRTSNGSLICSYGFNTAGQNTMLVNLDGSVTDTQTQYLSLGEDYFFNSTSSGYSLYKYDVSNNVYNEVGFNNFNGVMFNSMLISINNDKIYSFRSNGICYVYDISGAEIQRINCPSSIPSGISNTAGTTFFTKDGKYLISTSYKATLIWSLDSEFKEVSLSDLKTGYFNEHYTYFDPYYETLTQVASDDLGSIVTYRYVNGQWIEKKFTPEYKLLNGYLPCGVLPDGQSVFYLDADGTCGIYVAKSTESGWQANEYQNVLNSDKTLTGFSVSNIARNTTGQANTVLPDEITISIQYTGIDDADVDNVNMEID